MKHYKNNKDYDVIDICKDFSLDFNRGNIIKYVIRAGKKDDEIQDLNKAMDYLQREIEYLKTKKNETANRTIDTTDGRDSVRSNSSNE